MEEIEAAVNSLYDFRDLYFERHPVAEAAEKPSRLNAKMVECGERISSTADREPLCSKLRSDSRLRAELLYHRGRALNVGADHDPEAENLLSKAVKLDPAMIEAWNELGEAHWKRNDVDTAKTCFEGAVRLGKNKRSLRCLSIIMRQVPAASSEEKARNIESGLSMARQSVQLDTSDGQSWSILGNAYFAHFFNVSQNPRTLKQSMSAYRQAEKDPIAKGTPELNFNKGVAHKYEEDYAMAISCFERASALEPTWEEPKKHKKTLLKKLREIQNLIELKGKLKTKRFNALIESLNAEDKGDGHLGPYSGGSYSTSRGGSVSLAEVKSFADLAEGVNENKVVVGKVTCSVHSEESVPFTFCLTDGMGHCVAVNLYNLAPGKGVIIGDSVAIPEPYFTKIKLENSVDGGGSSGKAIEFDLIRVESPLVLVINGKKAARDLQAGIELSTFAAPSV